jgi:CPA2 family monovalent cation:H+ antiporter-2
MPHNTSLIATIVAGLGLAFLLGLAAQRLRLSPLVGYLLAGVLIGPFTPGYVADQGLASQLAEIGVILLMFGVGLHFSLADLLKVRAIAVPGAVGQIAIATLLGMALAWALGWGLGAGLVFGLALSVASTVVLLRALQERRIVETERGRIAVGWLIVEDLAMVLTLVLLPAIAGLLGGAAGGAGHAAAPGPDWLEPDSIWGVLLFTIAKVGLFVLIMLVVGRRLIPSILHYVAHTGSRELFRLAVLAIALGVAFGAAELFGVSFALGAFFAGMILAESPLSTQATRETLPLRDAFAVLFFVSVGMLFDPSILLREPLAVLATLLIIIVGKSIAAFAIVRAFGYPTATALTISASLAQIGEFSFILAGLGLSLGLLPAEGRDLILAGALISILVNPLLFAAIDRLEAARGGEVEVRPQADAVAADVVGDVDEAGAPAAGTALPSGHAVLVGHGRVGSRVGKDLAKGGLPFVVLEENADLVEVLRQAGVSVVAGSAGEPGLLEEAGIKRAAWLLVTIPDAFESGNLVERGRAANPSLKIIVRAHSDAEVAHLTRLGADAVVMGEVELAKGMVEAFKLHDGAGKADAAPPEPAPPPQSP